MKKGLYNLSVYKTYEFDFHNKNILLQISAEINKKVKRKIKY